MQKQFAASLGAGISRRALLGTTAVIPVVLALNGCAGLTAAQVAAQAVSDAQLVGNGLAAIVPQLGTIAKISAATVAAISADIQDVVRVAGTLSTSLTVTAAQPIVEQIEAAVNAVVAALAGLSLPTPIGSALAAIAVLLPLIESAVNLVVTQIPVPATARFGAVAPMSPDEARLILRGLAASRR